MKYFDEIEKSARERNIPVMEKEGLEFLIQTFKEHQCHRCLEIGSAIGYSAMMMVSNIDDFVVETIELDEERYQEALKNIHEQQLENQIEIHHEDAIGMGNDRRRVDDSRYKKICLCRMHHTMAHQLGVKRFREMYKVYGIVVKEG